MSGNKLRVPDSAYKELRKALEEAQPCDGDNPDFHLPDLRKWVERRTIEREVEKIEKERSNSNRSRWRHGLAAGHNAEKNTSAERGGED